MGKRLTHALAFVSKEFNEVRRQPRLILALILGPFLILLLFGIGYQGEQGNLSAIVVVPKEGNYSRDKAEYGKLTGGQLDIVSVINDEAAALRELQEQNVDLVVMVPEKISEQISRGGQVALPVYINEIDPLRRQSITYLTLFYANEINKQTIATAAGQGQESATNLRSLLVRMRNSLDAVDGHMASGEVQAANAQVRNLQGSASNTTLAVALAGQILAADTTIINPSQPQDPTRVNLAQGQEVANRMTANLQTLSDELEKPQPDTERVRAQVKTVRTDVDTLDRLTQQFQSINPLVLAAPFYADPQDKARTKTDFTTFFSPGVLVLLLQHIAITLASLSMVRERLLGTVELFRVSPTRPGEIMLGKYVGFLLMLGVISTVLLVMMSNNIVIEGVPLSLGVPILGDPWLLALTLALVTFASIGLGFFISAISRSESQAVQLSMLILLTSVFFSGFFLSLEALWPPVRAVSYALPVTHGIKALQDIMLRGIEPDWVFLLALAGIGIFFALLSYILFRRQFKRG